MNSPGINTPISGLNQRAIWPEGLLMEVPQSSPQERKLERIAHEMRPLKTRANIEKKVNREIPEPREKPTPLAYLSWFAVQKKILRRVFWFDILSVDGIRAEEVECLNGQTHRHRASAGTACQKGRGVICGAQALSQRTQNVECLDVTLVSLICRFNPHILNICKK
jgi:hypothetical protein